MKHYWIFLCLCSLVPALAGWRIGHHRHQRSVAAAEAADASWSTDELSSRESLVDILATPEMQANAAKQDGSYQAWATGQISGFCFVHRAQMKLKWLPVRYGLPDLSEVASKEDARDFPFPDEGVVFGPCSGGHIQEQEVYVCDECTHAYNGWLAGLREKRSAESPSWERRLATPAPDKAASPGVEATDL